MYQAVRDAALDTLHASDAWLLPTSRLVLPALYALLGSMMFHLRQYSLAIRSRTFDRDRRDLSRQLLAVTAGLMIGFFAPTSSLPIYAVSFLVGYSADVPFAELDGLIRRQLASRGDPRTDANLAAATPVGTVASARQAATNPTAARIAELNLLSTVVTNSVNAIFAPPEVVNYTGALAIEILDASGRNVVTSKGHMAEIVFPQPGSYAVSVWFMPDKAASAQPGAVLVSVQGGRAPADGSVPFELRADLGFAGMPLRLRHVAVDAVRPTQIDLGPIEVPLPDAGETTIRPDYPLSVTAYQHGQRYATCVIMPASSG